jgi:hypothetical protein
MLCFNVTWINSNGDEYGDTIYADSAMEADNFAREEADAEGVDYELDPEPVRF